LAQLQSDPAALLCSFVSQGDQDGKSCNLIKNALKNSPLPRAKPFAGDPSAKPRVVEPIDRSLGGLVEVTR